MKIIKPVLLNEKIIIKLAKEIINYNKEVLYNPLVDIYKNVFNKDLKLNDVNVLREALRNEKIFYENGYFKGKFNSKIVKELQKLGAKYIIGKGYKLTKELPIDLIDLLVEKKEKVKEAVNYMDELLNDMLNNMSNNLINENVLNFNETLSNYNNQIINNFDEFKIKVNLNENQEKLLNKKYIEESDILIKNMTIKQIKKLREKMKEYVLSDGYSNNYIAKLLQNEFGLAQDKAVFIARQESNSLMVEFTKQRYIDSGLDKFEWQTAGDEKVRSSHKILDKKVFSFDDLPIIDEATGKRGLPGEAVNCRCVMLPVID